MHTFPFSVVVSYTHRERPSASIGGRDFLLSYRVDSGPIVIERATSLGFIFSGSTASFIFKNTPELSQGTRTIHVQVSGVSDPNSAYNRSSSMVETQAFPSSTTVISCFLYVGDFEGRAGGWTSFAYGTDPDASGSARRSR